MTTTLSSTSVARSTRWSRTAAPPTRWRPSSAGRSTTSAPIRRCATLAPPERLDRFRQLLPDTTIGRHALSHIAWQLEQVERRGRPRPDRWRPPSLASTVHALYEAGYHAELNKRLKISRLPTLAGLHDIDLFAESAGTVTRAVVTALASEVGLVTTTAPAPAGRRARR